MSISILPRLARRDNLLCLPPSPLLVFLQAALDHVGDEVAERPPVLIGDGEEVFEDALGEGAGGASPPQGQGVVSSRPPVDLVPAR